MAKRKTAKRVVIRQKTPKGHILLDPARNAKQARSLRAAHKGNYSNPVIVRTGPSRGRGKVVFPYHIAVKRREYNRGGR